MYVLLSSLWIHIDPIDLGLKSEVSFINVFTFPLLLLLTTPPSKLNLNNHTQVPKVMHVCIFIHIYVYTYIHMYRYLNVHQRSRQTTASDPRRREVIVIHVACRSRAKDI